MQTELVVETIKSQTIVEKVEPQGSTLSPTRKPMKRLPQIIMAVAALLLLTLFIWPMWQIILIAPQYPDGVKMYIWINKLGGETPSTLQNINILNHYVGMRYIEPDDIPELKFLPIIVIGLVLLGMVASFVNKSKAFFAWGVLMIIAAVLGLYDFYLWEYEYGHNLSDTAPMKFPNAVFQPPLIGTKMILNFQATSLPHISGYFAGASILLAFVAWWLKKKLK